MNAPHALAPRPPSLAEADEATGLNGLLDLFSAEETSARTSPAAWPQLRTAPARFLTWTRASSQRAAAWGSGPQGAWRAW